MKEETIIVRKEIVMNEERIMSCPRKSICNSEIERQNYKKSSESLFTSLSVLQKMRVDDKNQAMARIGKQCTKCTGRCTNIKCKALEEIEEIKAGRGAEKWIKENHIKEEPNNFKR